MKMQPIDNGFFLISGKAAAKLVRQTRADVNARLPRIGYETDVVHEGNRYRLLRTRYDGKMRWSVYRTDLPFVFEFDK